MALAYSNIGQYKDAIQSYSNALEVNPNKLDTRVLLSDALFKHVMENSNADDSIEIATQALEHIDLCIEHGSRKYPRSYYLRCELGRFVGESDDINFQYCKAAIEANQVWKSDDVPAIFLVLEDVVLHTIGQMFKEAGNTIEATEYFSQGLAINPNSVDLLVNLASIYSDQTEYALATEYFNRAESVVSDPQVRSLLMTNRGWTMEKQGFHLAAMQIYNDAINIAPNPHPQLKLNLDNIERYCEQNLCN